MAAFNTKFPIEVIELIIDFLAIEDDESFSSIKACSLVSRALLPRARTYIFSSITINHWHHPDYTSLRFERLVSRAPVIAYYVTSLDYTAKEEDFTTEGFATALTSLTSLESLTLRLGSLEWKDLPDRASILNLMRMPMLSHLKLDNIRSFYFSDLTFCTGLKSLEANGFWSIEVCRKIQIYQELPLRLESYTGGSNAPPGLLMQLCTARRTDGKPAVDISGLKKVSLEVALGGLDALEEMFKVCTQLTDVHLSRSEILLMSGGFAGLFIPSLQTLRHVHLELFVLHNEDPFLPLVAELVSIAGQNVIESIKISVTVWLRVNWSRGDEWRALDGVFTQSETDWPKLKIFSLHVEVGYGVVQEPNDVEELVEELRKLPRTHLRRLAKHKGILFDFEVSAVETY